MTSSPDGGRDAAAVTVTDDLPPALSSMWRLCKLGYRHEPRLMLAAFVLSLLAALPDALLALWLELLGEGVLEHRPRLVRAAAIGLGVSAAATWFLRTVSTRVQRRFRDKVTIALESHVARLQASVATHRAPRAARLPRSARGAARPGVRARPHVHVAVLDLRLDPAARRDGRAARLDPSGARPARGLRAADRADVDVAAGVERAAQERGAQANRLARHLFTIATTAPPGKEVRVTGHRRAPRRPSGARRGSAGTGRSRRRAGARRCGTRWRGRSSAAPTSARSCSSRPGSARPPGDVLLVLAAGARLSAYIGATVGEIGFLRGFWMDGSRRLAWLEDYAASLVAAADLPVPARPAPRHPPRARLVRLSGHVAPRARRRVADAAGGRGRRDRRRERRRQDDARQAAREDVRADVGRDPRRRHAARARCRPTSGARGWPARSRTSSASSSARATPSASATCRAWTTSRRW